MGSSKKGEKAVINLFKSLNIQLLEETPKRYLNMLTELTEYQNISNKKIADRVNKIFPIDNRANSKDMVVVKDIEAFSLCQHHIALMYDMKISVGYIPKDFVLGLSKIVRMSEMICKRLQLQECIGSDILEVMSILTKSKDIAVHIKAKHSCVTARGIRNVNTETITTNFSGLFSDNDEIKISFLNSLKT